MSKPDSREIYPDGVALHGGTRAPTSIAISRDYSVAIPCFNGSDTLERALISVLDQSVTPMEVIVVDDGSADYEAVRAIVARHSPLVRLVRQDNRGPGAARNVAARLATSTWLAFLDADDSWHNDKMAIQFSLVTDVCTGLIFDNSGKNRGSPPPTPNFDDLWRYNWARTSAVVVLRSAFLSIDGFDEDSALVGAEDYNLWLRLTAAGWKSAAYDKSLIEYTPAVNSITSRIELCALGELNNIDKLQAQLGLDARRAEHKRMEIRMAFGRHLLHVRKIPIARAMLAAPARRVMPEALLLWLLTFLPESLLNMHRMVRNLRKRAS